MTSHELIANLLAATPAPPETGVENLLTAFVTMIARREELIAQAQPGPPAPAEKPLLEELARRDAAWRHALAEAHEDLVGQRIAATKVRAYAGGSRPF